jgi:leucyl-tRNA synthetase
MNDNQQKPPVGFDHTQIEKKWQEKWEKEALYKTAVTTDKPKYYVLDMFPYPSGTGLHVGHPRGYIASDIFARFKRMQGFNVLHPMGFDSFGLPAEQYAIKTGNHPGPHTDELVEHYKKQLSNIGFSYDWSREVATHKPEYYKWTQWIFLQLYNAWYNTETNKTESIETYIEKLSKEDSSWNRYSEKEKQDILMQHRIAYEGYAEVNWCPELGTVLANDEVVTAPDGSMVSERGEHPVIRKSMRQWFMRISAYADRLLAGLDTIDWPHSIKEIQRNWIGKSEGSEISFKLKVESYKEEQEIKVFTTRADTLFGVTYVVLAPEHELIESLKSHTKNKDEVEAYIAKVKATSEDDRINDKNEKTGVCLEGVYAVNPANGEKVPVWIANYVLASYGTGAVMAVPAHDERDFEFANIYNLPIKQVVVPGDSFKSIAVASTLQNAEEFKQQLKEAGISFELAVSVISGREHIRASFSKDKLDTFIGLVQQQITGTNWVEVVGTESIVIQKDSVQHGLLDNAEGWFEKFSEWEPFVRGQKNLWDMLGKNPFLREFVCYVDYGILRNSEKFDGLTSEEAKKKITEFVGGRLVTKYKMRDAIFARQRYWGEPIPLRHTDDGMISALTENELPLMLPEIEDFAPAGDGNSALSKSKEWMEKGYETNTMPGWAGSSWYFLRYMDPKNPQLFVSPEAVNYWGQVDMYVGGAEHATGHLLYSRFWNIALHDLGYVPYAEPFKALRNQGMIAGPDGRKMSKRWGNVINPDDVVARLGADTLRVYESFMGPFESHLPWSTDAIAGSRRFVERVYRLIENGKVGETTDTTLEKVLHKTIKKVTDDIQTFSFNTAVSSMMILLNEIEKSETISGADMKSFLKLLAPFAPHITEELWSSLGEAESIHLAPWPTFDQSKTVDTEFTIAVQINGKVRGSLVVSRDESEESIKEKAFALPQIAKYLEGQDIKKVVYIAGKIISVVL